MYVGGDAACMLTLRLSPRMPGTVWVGESGQSVAQSWEREKSEVTSLYLVIIILKRGTCRYVWPLKAFFLTYKSSAYK